MKEHKSLESVFKQALEHAEMPVDPALWQGVSAGLGAAGTAGAVGGLTVLTKVVIGVVAAAGISAAVWVGITPPNQNPAPAEQHNVVQEAPALISADQAQPEDEASLPIVQDQPLVDSHVEPVILEAAQSEPLAASTEPETEAEVGAPTSPEVQPDPIADPTVPTPNPVSVSPSQPVTAAPTPDPLLSAAFDSLRLDPLIPRYLLKADYQEAATYHWFVEGDKMGEGRQLSYLFEQEGLLEVLLRVTDESGKKQEFEMLFDLERIEPSQVVVPQIFTPSSAGSNDLLDLETLSTNCTLLRLWVFDYNGTLYFESTETLHTWDGLDVNGNLCQGDFLVRYVMLGTDGVLHRGEQLVRVN